MSVDEVRENLKHMGEMTRQVYVFANQLITIKNLEAKGSAVDKKEKKLLEDSINSLIEQLKILNNSIPSLIDRIGFFKELPAEKSSIKKSDKNNLVQLKYNPGEDKEKIALTINKDEKKDFVNNLSKSSLSIDQLKKEYSSEQAEPAFSINKPNPYAKISNRFFRELSNKIIAQGYFKKLNDDLRKVSSPFILSTYVSMIFFAVSVTFIISFVLFGILLFFNLSPLFPYFIPAKESVFVRLIKFFWIVPVFPLVAGFIVYSSPAGEGKSIGGKIDQELPFVVIHMSAIATSGIESLNLFKIILKSKEYPSTNREFTKLMNLVNFQGDDLVTALKKIAKSSPSAKLRELLDGLSNTITTGGQMNLFLNKHAETLLFDYKLEREKYTKLSETFMDIYISLVIAAPMILLMLFVILGSTGALSSFLGLSTSMLGFLIIMAIAVLNIGFLIFLKFKQPAF